MGGSFPFGAGSSAEPFGAEETEEGGDEDESIVHHTASVGDDEVMEILIEFCFIIFNWAVLDLYMFLYCAGDATLLYQCPLVQLSVCHIYLIWMISVEYSYRNHVDVFKYGELAWTLKYCMYYNDVDMFK